MGGFPPGRVAIVKEAAAEAALENFAMDEKIYGVSKLLGSHGRWNQRKNGASGRRQENGGVWERRGREDATARLIRPLPSPGGRGSPEPFGKIFLEGDVVPPLNDEGGFSKILAGGMSLFLGGGWLRKT